MLNCVEKIGQYFVMSRYMWRKYNQNWKKRSRLDSPELGESRKVPLTPAERARLTGSEKDCAISTSRIPVRLLCETPTMKHQWNVPEAKRRNQWSVPEAKPMSWWWTPQKYPSCSPEKTSIRDSHVAIVTSTRRSWRTTLIMLAMCAIDFGLEKT
jgi:hypothetical protein